MKRVKQWLYRHLAWVPVSVREYVATLIEEMGNLTALFLMSLLLCWGCWYAIFAAWGLYTSTHTGHYFELYYPEHAAIVGWYLEQSAWQLSVEISVVGLIVSLVMTAITQLTFLRHIFYSRRGFLMKLAVVLLVNWVLVSEVQKIADTASGGVFVYAIFLPATLLLVPGAMRAAGDLLPDPNDVLSAVYWIKNRLLPSIEDDPIS